jgi:hypothetical protein
MGYTHHDAISVTGSGGIAVGSASAGESVVINTAGALTLAGAITATGDITIGGVQQNTAQGVLQTASTDGGTTWHVSPYACNITASVALSVSSGTGRVVSVVHGSAGDNAASWAGGASGTIGAVKAMTASAVPSLTAGEVFRVVQASCATAQISGVTIVLTKT